MTDGVQNGPAGPTRRQRLWTASRSARRLLSNERQATAAEQLAALAASPHAVTAEPVDTYGDGIVGRRRGLARKRDAQQLERRAMLQAQLRGAR